MLEGVSMIKTEPPFNTYYTTTCLYAAFVDTCVFAISKLTKDF